MEVIIPRWDFIDVNGRLQALNQGEPFRADPISLAEQTPPLEPETYTLRVFSPNNSVFEFIEISRGWFENLTDPRLRYTGFRPSLNNYRVESAVTVTDTDGDRHRLQVGYIFEINPVPNTPPNPVSVEVQVRAVDAVCENVQLTPVQRALIRTIARWHGVGIALHPGGALTVTIEMPACEVSSEWALTSELPRPLAGNDAPIRSRYEILGDDESFL